MRPAPRQSRSRLLPSAQVRELKERLWRAAELGDLDGVLQALRDGADPNSDLASSNETPLILAIHSGAKDVVAALIDAGADVERAPKYESTPLMSAIDAAADSLSREEGARKTGAQKSDETLGRTRAERNAIVELLLDAGADPARHARPIDDPLAINDVAVATLRPCASPFWRAFFKSDTEWLVRFAALLPQSAVDDAAMAIARKGRDIASAGAVTEPMCCAALDGLRARLSEATREALTPIWLFTRDPEAHDALRASILDEDSDAVEAAIARGVPVNACPPGELTPLAVAVDLNWPEGVGLLLDAGADACIFLCDNLGRWGTPQPCRDSLSFAVRKGATHCVRTILRHGTRELARTGASPLRAAIQDALLAAAWEIEPYHTRLLAPHATREEIESTAARRIKDCRGQAEDAATIDELLAHLQLLDSPKATALRARAFRIFSATVHSDGRPMPLHKLLPKAYAQDEATHLRKVGRRKHAGSQRQESTATPALAPVARSSIARRL